MSDGLLKLMSVEEYLDMQVHEAEKGEAFHGSDSSLTEYFEDGHEFISELIADTSTEQDFASSVTAELEKRVEELVDVVLFCPRCKFQHIDKAEPDICQECGHAAYFHQGPQKICLGHINAACNCQSFVAWLNPPHKSHRCSNCNTVWRPADVPTNGVERAKTVGSNDTELSQAKED